MAIGATVTNQYNRAGLGEVRQSVELAVRKLLAYCQSSNWAGFDPYDALNSQIVKSVPLLDRRIPRLVLTQALKRSPINLRPLLLVPPTQNPKGLALFLTSLLKLSELGFVDSGDARKELVERIIDLRSQGVS